MIEMMGVIAIIGVLAVGVWTLIGSALYKYRISQTSIQIQSLSKGISRFYALSGNYDKLGDTNAIKKLIDSRVPDPAMISGDNSLRHAFGGEVNIAPVFYTNTDDYGTSSDSFAITFKDISSKVCVELASMTWAENDAANLVSIKIGNDKYCWAGPYQESGCKGYLPITVDKSIASCTAAKTDITWEFR